MSDLNNEKTKKSHVSRKEFLGIAWAGSILTLLGAGAAALFKFIQPVNTDGFGGIIQVGKVEDFTLGSVTPVQAGRFYLVRLENGSFIALWQKCTHLGCSVPWVESEKQFHCPCHGSLFSTVGEVTGGPAPRPMDYFRVEIKEGEVFVDTGNPKERSKFKSNQTTKV